jgi:spoIIIJ-associated protein
VEFSARDASFGEAREAAASPDLPGRSARGGPATRVRDLMHQVALAAGLKTEVDVREDDECVWGEFVGADADSLIRDHGRTIDAIQHLAYRIAFPGSSPRKSVVIDAAGYRARRADSLRAAADQAVEAALNQGRPVPLEPMNAIERKLVHEHLRDRRGVETYSEGEEPERRLVVAPVVGAQP